MRFLWLYASLISATLGAQLVEREQVEVTSSNAVIHWITDVPTSTRAEINSTSAKVSVANSRGPTTNHTVTVNGLVPGTQYKIKLGTARVWLTTTTFIASSSPLRNQTVERGNTNLTRDPDSISAPPTKKTWANLATLPDHFKRHGSDFQARDAEDYARMAWEFLQHAKATGLPAKLDEEDVLRVYDPRTRTFAVYNREGKTKTFFKAQNPSYFERQPGRLINLKQEQ